MRIVKSAVAIAAVFLVGCNLDVTNPNQPGRDKVEATPVRIALATLATGLQGRFASSYFSFAYASGLVTDEFASASAALVSISDAEQGNVPPGTGIADAVFNSVYRTVRSADELLRDSLLLAPGVDVGTRSGLRALAFAIKAEALGEALQTYQRIPVNTFGTTQPVYVSRTDALPLIRAMLDTAARLVTDTAPSAIFNAEMLTPGVSLPNLIQMYRARYARMAGDDAGALAAANLVSRSSVSQVTFVAPTTNPFSGVTGGVNGIGPRRQWRLSMEVGDQRFGYFVAPQTAVSGRIGALLDGFSRYALPSANLPLLFPDEALLIKAEALLAQGDAAGARAAIDSVRVDCTGGRGVDDPKACLTPLAGAFSNAQLLDEVYRQRRYELYGTGLRWEDSRRRSQIVGPTAAPAVPTGGQRCWMPYSIGDRNANSNVPADPTEPRPLPTGCPL